MRLLENPIRSYGWGSRTALATLQRRHTPSATSEAELWIGAHPDDPSGVAGTPLDRMIASCPESLLGAANALRFGPRLPFLVKVLAADRPLSIQVHPDKNQAVAGYHAEQAAGLPATSVDRNYRDANHKPELLVALTPFEALAGLRPVAESLDDVRRLGIEALAGVEAALASRDLRTAVELLLTWPERDRERLVTELVAVAHLLPGMRGRVVRQLAEAYPADPGVGLSLLLDHIVLAPGEALFMPARELHCYLRGVGVEVMAASDNVLRGGLTSKRVDVQELMRITSFTPRRARPLPSVVAPNGRTWRAPVADFKVRRIRVDAQPLSLNPLGPRIALCVSGHASVADDNSGTDLTSGDAAFGAATGGPVRVAGNGDLFLVSL